MNLRKLQEGRELSEGDPVSKRQILAEKLRKRRERKERMKKFRAIKKARRAAREAAAAKLAASNPAKPAPSSAKPANISLRAGVKPPTSLKPAATNSDTAPTQGEIDKLKQRAIDALERDVADLSRLSAPTSSLPLPPPPPPPVLPSPLLSFSPFTHIIPSLLHLSMFFSHRLNLPYT